MKLANLAIIMLMCSLISSACHNITEYNIDALGDIPGTIIEMVDITSDTAKAPEDISGWPETDAFVNNEPELNLGPEYGEPGFEPLVPLTERADDAFFDDALFFGDSQILCLKNYQTIKNAEYLGISGMNTYRALTGTLKELNDMYVEDFLTLYSHKKLYILLGQNDLEMFEVPRFIKYYTELIERIKEKNPEKTLFIISVFPVIKDYFYGMFDNVSINESNDALYEMCHNLGLYYVNLWEALADDELCLESSYASKDGVHLRVAGCQAVSEYLYTHYVN